MLSKLVRVLPLARPLSPPAPPRIRARARGAGVGAPLLLCALALILLPLGVAIAQTDPTDDEVNVIAKGLYCPVCENVPLDVCGTQACAQWRATIRELLGEGRSAEEIKQYFANQYGDRVLAEPPARGLNIVFWLLPPLAVMGGAFFLWRYLRRSAAAQAATVTTGAAGSDDEYVARLERLLDQRR